MVRSSEIVPHLAFGELHWFFCKDPIKRHGDNVRPLDALAKRTPEAGTLQPAHENGRQVLSIQVAAQNNGSPSGVVSLNQPGSRPVDGPGFSRSFGSQDERCK